MKMAAKMCCSTPLMVMVMMMVTAAMIVMGAGSQHNLVPADYTSIQERCRRYRTDVFPHPGQCQLYYNCSHHTAPDSPLFHPFLMECPYPLLFSHTTLRCEPFDQVTCGSRKEFVDYCDYLSGQCAGPGCRSCWSTLPSCQGLPDGGNALPWGESDKTPEFMVCQGGRTVGRARCADQYTVYNSPTFYHPKKRVCVHEQDLPQQ